MSEYMAMVACDDFLARVFGGTHELFFVYLKDILFVILEGVRQSRTTDRIYVDSIAALSALGGSLAPE